MLFIRVTKPKTAFFFYLFFYSTYIRVKFSPDNSLGVNSVRYDYRTSPFTIVERIFKLRIIFSFWHFFTLHICSDASLVNIFLSLLVRRMYSCCVCFRISCFQKTTETVINHKYKFIQFRKDNVLHYYKCLTYKTPYIYRFFILNFVILDIFAIISLQYRHIVSQ